MKWLWGRHALRPDWQERPADQSFPPAVPADKTLLGIHAERLISDPVLSLAFESVERDLTEIWRNSAAGEVEQREVAYQMIWALASVKTKLQVLLADK